MESRCLPAHAPRRLALRRTLAPGLVARAESFLPPVPSHWDVVLRSHYALTDSCAGCVEAGRGGGCHEPLERSLPALRRSAAELYAHRAIRRADVGRFGVRQCPRCHEAVSFDHRNRLRAVGSSMRCRCMRRRDQDSLCA